MGAFKHIDKDAFTDLLSVKSHFIVDHHKKDILERKTGKIRFPDDVLQNARAEESDDSSAGATYTMVDLFKNSSMACITVNIMFQWFVNTMTYYGLLFGAGELPGSGNRFKFIVYRTGAWERPLNHIIRPTSETKNRL